MCVHIHLFRSFSNASLFACELQSSSSLVLPFVLQSLEDLLHLPPSPLSQTPFFLHILSSLPSLRSQIRDAVTASEKSWLFDVRSSSGQIGRLATEEMARRIKKWRNRKEKDGGLLGGTARLGRVGGAVESVMNEKNECEYALRVEGQTSPRALELIPFVLPFCSVDVLNNEEIKIDFKPLFQCIHIYDALNARAELQRNYQEDRKVSTRRPFVLPTPTLPLLFID